MNANENTKILDEIKCERYNLHQSHDGAGAIFWAIQRYKATITLMRV